MHRRKKPVCSCRWLCMSMHVHRDRNPKQGGSHIFIYYAYACVHICTIYKYIRPGWQDAEWHQSQEEFLGLLVHLHVVDTFVSSRSHIHGWCSGNFEGGWWHGITLTWWRRSEADASSGSLILDIGPFGVAQSSCVRKEPCQECSQVIVTGLCVYYTGLWKKLNEKLYTTEDICVLGREKSQGVFRSLTMEVGCGVISRFQFHFDRSVRLRLTEFLILAGSTWYGRL